MNIPWIIGSVVLGIIVGAIVWQAPATRQWLDENLPEEYWVYAIILIVVVVFVAIGWFLL